MGAGVGPAAPRPPRQGSTVNAAVATAFGEGLRRRQRMPKKTSTNPAARPSHRERGAVVTVLMSTAWEPDRTVGGALGPRGPSRAPRRQRDQGRELSNASLFSVSSPGEWFASSSSRREFSSFPFASEPVKRGDRAGNRESIGQPGGDRRPGLLCCKRVR